MVILASFTSLCAACSQTPVVLPSRDLDRPTDMTFACLGVTRSDGKVTAISGQPMGKCHPSGREDPKPGTIDPNGGQYRTYSFVTNADRGDLSVIDMSYCRPQDSACHPPGARLVDLDPTSFGFGAAPLGELPEGLVASQDGCRLLAANRGSCDLSLVDPAALLTRTLDPGNDLATPPSLRGAVTTIVPLTETDRLHVAPGEIAFVPQQTALLGDAAPVCDSTMPGTLAPPVGDAAPGDGQRVPWRAVATFPSCDLVALVELPSGMILDSYQIVMTSDAQANPFVHTGRNPVCPATDCPFQAGGPTAPLGISALAMHPEGTRIYVGGTNTPKVYVLDIAGPAFVEPTLPTAHVVELSDGARGIERLRLSVDPYAASKGFDAHQAGDLTAAARPEYGRFVAGRHDDQPADPLEFLYVIAKDGSLRVADVAGAVPVECDLGIDPLDPLALATPPDPDDAVRKACFAYKAPNGPRRLLSAGIPGHRFPSPPQDIAFANYRTPPTSTPSAPTVDEQLMSGAFAFVMTNAGAVYVLNIDPELRRTKQVWRDEQGALHSNCAVKLPNGTCDPSLDDTEVAESPRPLTHSFRDFNVVTYSTSLGSQIGPPRVDTAPNMPVEGPTLRAFIPTESRIDARLVPPGIATGLATYAYFPNRATVHPQTWRIEWEGDVSGVRLTGSIVDPLSSDATLSTTIMDGGSGFCGLGGAPGDVMTLVGCDTDSGCPVGNLCVHGQQVLPAVDGRSIQGMCLPRSMTNHEICEPMLKTFRRYEIVSGPTASTTTVVPRRAEIPRPAYTNAQGERASCDPAHVDPDGRFLDCVFPTSQSFDKFTCEEMKVQADGTALPEDALRWRCLQKCKADEECRPGRICVAYAGDDRKYCAEGAPIVKSCGLDQLVAYKLSAGSSFVVTGSVSGRTEGYHLEQSATGGAPTCVRNPSVSDLVARIPMNTHLCGPDSTPAVVDGKFSWDDAFLGRSAGPNYPATDPCFICERARDKDNVLVPGLAQSCSPDGSTISAVFQNTELRFVLTDLQKEFTGPLQIQFTVNGGISQQQVFPSSDATPGVPARILVGPVSSADQTPPWCSFGTMDCSGPGRYSELPYLYVVDQRQFSGGRLGARGQILRITPRVSPTAPFAGFETFAGSGSYFPIQ
jgi:hypothetical protein